jgi:hypothetical protein
MDTKMHTKFRTPRATRARARTSVAGAVGALIALTQWASPAHAGTAEQAVRIHNRIAGVPPSATVLANMVSALNANDTATAAKYATDNPNFYNVTLKNFAAPWTNRDQTVFVPLNDYTATVIGMVRDDIPFNTVLSGDILYTSNASGLPAPSNANNNHYATADANGVDLKATLVQTMQSAAYGLPSAATAGVMTTYGGASAFFINGTNRAMFRFTMINHLCNDMEAVQDITRPTDRIRQDVSRSPGGDSRIFLNNCVGCHSGMDPMAQAFAYYNFDTTAGALVYTAGAVQAKYHINSANFPQGFVTPDDAWENRWRQGPNSVLGFDPSLPGAGNGAKTLGQELAGSDAFAACQVQKVFQAVCFRSPGNAADRNAVATIKASFKGNGYKLKQVFVDTALYCKGQ